MVIPSVNFRIPELRDLAGTPRRKMRETCRNHGLRGMVLIRRFRSRSTTPPRGPRFYIY